MLLLPVSLVGENVGLFTYLLFFVIQDDLNSGFTIYQLILFLMLLMSRLIRGFQPGTSAAVDATLETQQLTFCSSLFI